VSEEAIEIAVAGVALAGVAGMGDAAHGPLRVAVRDPTDELRASAIDVGSAGQVLVGGSRASAEALIRARAMGVAAIVLSGALDKELRDFAAIQARRREIGAGAAPLTILLLGGYGKVPMDPLMLDWFRRHEARLATCLGADRRLYVHDAEPPPTRTPLAYPGARVVALRRPHAGATGVLVRQLDAPRAAASGVSGRTALVRFDDGRIAEVPLANLEAVSGG
jgi:hypothetical protein